MNAGPVGPLNASPAPDEIVRAFIAVHINDAVRDELARAQARLKRSGAHVAWVRPENVHLTLVFLGDVSGRQLAELASRLDRIALVTAAFSCVAAGIGAFGGERRPRVVWAGVMAGCVPALHSLYGAASDAAVAAGMRVEAWPFAAHMTLGRVRSSRNVAALAAEVGKLRESSFGVFPVHGVSVMRSVLGSQGPTYTVLHEATFSGEGRS